MVAMLDFSDLEKKYACTKPDPTEGIVVVDGLPVIAAAKVPKLENVLKKIFGGEVSQLHMCCSDDGSSKGFAFLEFSSAELAAIAVEKGNNYKLDKSHTLLVNHLKDIQEIEKVPTEYCDPEIDAFEEKDFLKYWLLDPRDQFAVLKQEWTSVYANNQDAEASLVHERNNWSEMYISWSPKGSYLTTLHIQGVAIWGGVNWTKIARFAHMNVKLIDFSPNEEYLATWSLEGFAVGESTHHLNIWHLSSGKKLRSFPLDPSSFQHASTTSTGTSVQIPWPVFKWSADSKYIARFKSTGIFVYETETMALLGKKAISVENVQNIEWSPSEAILSYWTPESGNIPARVSMMKIPTREIIRTKNLFSVQHVNMYWQSSGEYLLIDVTQLKKKQTSAHLEIFRVKEKGIPIDVIDRKSSETINQLTWEPNGKRFSMIATEGQKTMVYFYEMITETDKNLEKIEAGVEIALIHSMEVRGINTVSWSPAGRFCVLGGIRAYTGTLEFWDTESMTLMSSSEHDMCTHLDWDPSGRFVTTSVSFWNVQTDTGYIMWSFTGTLLIKKVIPVMKQFCWRPRPESMLSQEKKDEIRQNIKKYSTVFEKEDSARRNKTDQEIIDKRLRLWNEWIAFRKTSHTVFLKETQNRIKLYGFDPDSKKEDEEYLEEIVEEIIEETEELV